MSNNAYELLSLAARYLFTGLMLLIVLRAWKITITDNRRAKKLRQIAPETGLSGELVVLEGGERAREGMRYPVIREGMIGSSRKADIRIRHSSIRRIHAYFELTEEGLKVRAHKDAPISKSWEEPRRALLLKDGDTVEFGGVHLLLVLSGAQGASFAPAPARDAQAEDDGLFGLSADESEQDSEMMLSGSEGFSRGARRPGAAAPRPAGSAVAPRGRANRGSTPSAGFEPDDIDAPVEVPLSHRRKRPASVSAREEMPEASRPALRSAHARASVREVNRPEYEYTDAFETEGFADPRANSSHPGRPAKKRPASNRRNSDWTEDEPGDARQTRAGEVWYEDDEDAPVAPDSYEEPRLYSLREFPEAREATPRHQKQSGRAATPSAAAGKKRGGPFDDEDEDLWL